jgi:hypothetical protein
MELVDIARLILGRRAFRLFREKVAVEERVSELDGVIRGGGLDPPECGYLNSEHDDLVRQHERDIHTIQKDLEYLYQPDEIIDQIENLHASR